MAKRRTKRQKREAKHFFTASWQPKSGSNKVIVKRQKKKNSKTQKLKNSKKNSTEDTDKNNKLGTITHDVTRSIFIASLILSLELVIYLIWRK